MPLLPRKFTTSVERIKKIARESQELTILGPGLIGVR
jgi:hypothetical protein